MKVLIFDYSSCYMLDVTLSKMDEAIIEKVFDGDVEEYLYAIEDSLHIRMKDCYFMVPSDEEDYTAIINRGSHLTDEERTLVSQAAADLESGNHLLHERTEAERAMLSELAVTLDTPKWERNERQLEIAEVYKLCTDYDYAKKHGTENH